MKKAIKETENQAVGTMVAVNNISRIEKMTAAQLQANNDYLKAINELNDGRKSIEKLIESRRGTNTGLHGFIGERAQVYISNARDYAKGREAKYTLIDDNGPVDYMKGHIAIQQKAYKSGAGLGLEPVIKHAEKYPSFVKAGGCYQIPKDNYEEYLMMSSLSEETANKFRKTDYRKWKSAKEFNENYADINLGAMVTNYDEIQANTIEHTLDKEHNKINEIHNKRLRTAIDKSRASLAEGIAVTTYAAGIEAGTEGLISILEKRKTGKKVADFNKNDWNDVGLSSVKGLGKGAIRGAATYTLSNGCGIPAPVASSAVTVALKTTEEIKSLREGTQTICECKKRVLEHCEDSCVGLVASQMGSWCLEMILPRKYKGLAKITGSIIGSYVGMRLYGAFKNKEKEA